MRRFEGSEEIMSEKIDQLGHESPLNRERSANYKQLDDELDEGLKETFPGSDPVSVIQPVPDKSKKSNANSVLQRFESVSSSVL
jgi:hypothetical protein